MDIIYLINTEKGPYIGKLSNEKFLEDHLRRSGMFTKNTPVEAWEASWAADLRQNGLASSSFIKGTEYWEENTVRAKLAQSFDLILEKQQYRNIVSGSQMLDWIGKMWGRSDTLSVTEALCIILAAKDYSIINLKIDFLSHNAGFDPKQLFTKKEVDRIQEAVSKKWMPEIFITFTMENADNYDKMEEKIQKDLEKQGYARTGILKNPQVVQWLKNQSTEYMKSHIIKSLQDYKKYLQNNRNVSNKAIYTYIDDVIKEVKNSSASNRIEIVDIVNEMFSDNKWKKKVERNYNFATVNDNINAILNLLNDWYNSTSIDNILGPLNISNSLNDNFITHYKNQFTKFISSLLDKAISYEPTYSDKGGWLEEKIKKDGEQWGLSQYYNWFQTKPDDKNYIPPEQQSLMEISNPKTNNFIATYWPPIYAEQIILWLREKHPESFLLQRRDLVDGYKRDISSPSEIEYY